MIYDKIENIYRYSAISPVFREVAESLKSTDFARLSPGRYDIGSSGTYFMVQEPKLAPPEACFWEYHESCIDIQFAFSGGDEIIGFAFRDEISKWTRQDGTDTFLSADPLTGTGLSLHKGFFAVFFPQDAHRPCMGAVKAGGYRKIVYKIPMENKL